MAAASKKVGYLKMAVFWAITLMMESASTSETSVIFYQTTGATTQKAVIFILAAVRT
jgi:hypothetical protein